MKPVLASATRPCVFSRCLAGIFWRVGDSHSSRFGHTFHDCRLLDPFSHSSQPGEGDCQLGNMSRNGASSDEDVDAARSLKDVRQVSFEQTARVNTLCRRPRLLCSGLHMSSFLLTSLSTWNGKCERQQGQPGKVPNLQVKTEKKKVGRPILYSGNPDAPHLTSAERRCIKRRAANRESARRVRTRRQDTIDGMTAHLRKLEEENKQLSQRASSLDEAHAALKSQHARLRQHLHVANMENYGLKREICSLRSIVHVRRLLYLDFWLM